MNKYRKIGALAVTAVLAALLAGCGGDTPQQTQAAATVPEVYTVSFYSRGQMVYQEQVEAGDSPERMPTIASPAYVADAWVDAQGNEVDPQSVPVYGDCQYTVVEFPAFTNFVPYLFADENGFIRPDDTLTGGELQAALEALVYDTAALDGISMPGAEENITKEILSGLLTQLFPAEELENVLFNVRDGEVTRASFARLMNTLLGRYGTDTVVIAGGQTLPRDLALDRTDSAAVLAAALTYNTAEDGLPMMQAVLEMPWEPGFTLLDGWLYYADENGTLLRNGKVGTMVFGEDGRYTSGDAELDQIVAENLSTFIAENPQQERFELLYTAFLHCRDDYKYIGRGLLDAGETGWETEWAKQMFTTGAGNCYSYAAIFWAYARGLGYDAYCVSGYTTEEYDPHGWVEIEMEEGLRIFDPELAMAYLRDGKNYEATFNMEYALAVQWPYYWP